MLKWVDRQVGLTDVEMGGLTDAEMGGLTDAEMGGLTEWTGRR